MVQNLNHNPSTAKAWHTTKKQSSVSVHKKPHITQVPNAYLAFFHNISTNKPPNVKNANRVRLTIQSLRNVQDVQPLTFIASRRTNVCVLWLHRLTMGSSVMLAIYRNIGIWMIRYVSIVTLVNITMLICWNVLGVRRSHRLLLKESVRNVLNKTNTIQIPIYVKVSKSNAHQTTYTILKQRLVYVRMIYHLIQVRNVLHVCYQNIGILMITSVRHVQLESITTSN